MQMAKTAFRLSCLVSFFLLATLPKKRKEGVQSSASIVPFVYGPKRPMRHLLGAEKNNFFNSRH